MEIFLFTEVNIGALRGLRKEHKMVEQHSVQPGSSTEKQTYPIKEIAGILGISERTAYHICSKTKDFKVMRLGRTIRVQKASFDAWFTSSE